MISIVVCSINPVYLTQLKGNIDSTINVEYEILIWDNRADNIGICEVYNKMADKAKFEYICFLHEDIIFDTVNWGLEIDKIFFSNPNIGLIGVAGSKYKSKCFSGWYTGIKEFDCANIIHRYPDKDEHIYLKPDIIDNTVDVVCIDGVFICCRKSIWEKINFDQVNLRGFHFYDIDFSIRASFICTVVVTYNILITHLTIGGDFGDKWVKAAIGYHLLKKDTLPVYEKPEQDVAMNEKITKRWLDVLKSQKISFKNKWGWISKQELFTTPKYYYSVLKFILYKPLGLRYIHKLFQKR